MPLRRTAGRVTNADLALVLTGGGARGAYQVAFSGTSRRGIPICRPES
jgi:hypothetical protein